MVFICSMRSWNVHRKFGHEDNAIWICSHVTGLNQSFRNS